MSANVNQEQIAWDEQGLKQAIIELKSGETAELISFLRERIEDSDACCYTHRTNLLNELGLVMLDEEDVQQAEFCFSEALKIDPMAVSAAYNLANLALHNDDFDKAIGLYERVILVQPVFVGAQFNLALCYLYSDQIEKAQGHFVRAANIQPDFHNANYWAGETLLRKNSFVESAIYFKQAYKLNPNHFETVNGYAMALNGAGEHDQAIEICDKSLQALGPSVVSLRTKADAMLALDRVQEAVLCHLDIAHIDLDARDLIVSRLQALHQQNLDQFERYKDFMLDRNPQFEPLLAVIRQFENSSTDCH
jgi:tetratricopeptide (TPR) repeat protein